MFLCWQKIKVLLKPSGEREAGDLEIVCIEQVSAVEKRESSHVSNVSSWTNWLYWNYVTEVTSNFSRDEILPITTWGTAWVQGLGLWLEEATTNQEGLGTVDLCRLTYQSLSLFEITRQFMCRIVVLDWLQDQTRFPIHVPLSGLRLQMAVLETVWSWSSWISFLS